MKTGVANLPLHGGNCPAWLFPRMKKLSGGICEAIVMEYGQDELLKRFADPFFFQSFGCVLGFDHHSSGVTTTVCGATKEAVNELNLGIIVAGGKGKSSRKTPSEIESNSFNLSSVKVEKLKYASRTSAKIDSNLVQDGYQLYHHTFVFTEKGSWAVVQQGMNSENNYARRYHWLSDSISSFVDEPHNAICGEQEKDVLDMTAKESKEAQKTSVDMVNDNPEHLRKYLAGQKTLHDFATLTMKQAHPVYLKDLTEKTIKTLKAAYELQPENYEELIALKGIGAKSVRALALISELVYGTKASWKDPAKHSFAHGGKDGFPYPVDRQNYDSSIEILKTALDGAKLNEKEKINAIRLLKEFIK